MARIAVIGSCITRDLWPQGEQGPRDLLYISRTSLASLVSTPVPGYVAEAPPTPGLTRFQNLAVKADLMKTALGRLVAHQPTHIIFDFIDERFDLLTLPGGVVVTHSWELETGGYLDAPALSDVRPLPRLSEACEARWREACAQLRLILEATSLCEAQIILHSARWADRQAGPDGPCPLAGEPQILPGRPADIAVHNDLLARYEDWFLAQVPRASVVSARPEHRLADPQHRWGLSPFHYVDAYYEDIRQGLAALGV